MNQTERTQHTPAPWKFMEPDGTEYPTQAIGAVYTDTKLIATVWGNEKVAMPWRSNDEGEANARLIAASPRMYDFISQKAREGDADAAAIIASI